MKTPGIEIGIPTRNRPEYLSLLLFSLKNQTYRNWDLTIIDDNDDPMLISSHHLCSSLIKNLELEGHRVRIIRGVRKGPPFAHNLVLENTKKPYILRIDDDVICRSFDMLEKFVKRAAKIKNFGAAGGVFIWPEAPAEKQVLPKSYMKEDYYKGKFDRNVCSTLQKFMHPDIKPKEVEYLLGGVVFYNRLLALEIGGFQKDLSYVAAYEEFMFSHKLFMAGGRLFVFPDLVFYHFCSPSGGIRKNKAEYIKNSRADYKIFLDFVKKTGK